jgi:carbamoyl-phosphate synthase large subunit
VLIRQEALLHRIPVITTLSGAMAAVNAIEALARGGLAARALQDYYL